MKRIFTLVVMAVLAMSTMWANWQPSDTEATRLDAEGTSGQSLMKTLRTDDGKIILSWLRGERVDGVFSYGLHFQVFDANGNAQFGDEGVIVSQKPSVTWTTDYGFALAPNGDILFAFYDIRNDPDNQEFNDAYLYRYNQQGQPVWDADGVLFPVQPISEHPLSIENISPKLCVSGDMAALGVYRASRARGIRIPEDLSIVGYDNTALTSYTVPELTSVDQHPDQIGKVIATTIHNMMRHHPVGDSVLRPSMVIRGSTAAPPSAL